MIARRSLLKSIPLLFAAPAIVRASSLMKVTPLPVLGEYTVSGDTVGYSSVGNVILRRPLVRLYGMYLDPVAVAHGNAELSFDNGKTWEPAQGWRIDNFGTHALLTNGKDRIVRVTSLEFQQ